MTTRQTKEEITFVLEAKDRASQEFDKVNEAAGRGLEMYQKLGVAVLLWDRRVQWLLRTLFKLDLLLDKLAFAAYDAAIAIDRFGVRIGGYGRALGIFAKVLGGAAIAWAAVTTAIHIGNKALDAANAVIAKGAVGWQTFRTASNRAWIQLRTMGLSIADTHAAIDGLNRSTSRYIATSLLQSTEFMGLAATAGTGLSGAIAKIVKEAELLQYADPAGLGIALAKAYQGSTGELDNLLGSMNIMVTDTMTVQEKVDLLKTAMSEAWETGVGGLRENTIAQREYDEAVARSRAPWEKLGLTISTFWLSNVMTPMKEAEATFTEWMFSIGGFLFEFFTFPITNTFALLGNAIDGLVKIWALTLGKLITAFDDWWDETAWPGITSAFSSLWTWIKDSAGTYWDNTLGELITKFVTWWVNMAWPGITGSFSMLWDAIKSTAGTVWDSTLGSLLTKFETWTTTAWTTIKTLFTGLWESIKSIATGIFDSLWESVKSGFVSAVRWVWDKIPSMVRDRIPGAGGIKDLLEAYPEVESYQRGGIVPGPLGRAVPAIVHGGEYIIPAPQVSRGLANNSNNGFNQVTIPISIGGNLLGELVLDILNREARWKAGLMPGTVGS